MANTAELIESYHPLKTSADLDPLLERIGEARYVLLGEASHGTHEYYTWRTELSKRLIREKGFSFIAVEGDWPDCYTVNQYVKSYPDADASALATLKKFNRWPTWMWANWEIAALIDWMRAFNRHLPDDRKVGFYGLDVYSLWESMEVIVEYLRREDPRAAELAMDALRCFEPYEQGVDYSRAMMQLSPNCTDEVIRLLQEVKRRSPRYDHDREAPLNAEMNARVVADAEHYYRSMVSFRDDSWNVRDTHMAKTLNALTRFHGEKSKAIVWEHNTHVGDARYTDMHKNGLVNVGQLAREKYRDDGVFIAGFSSYSGSVIAGRRWAAPMEKMTVPPAMNGSVEEILHRESAENKLLLFDKKNPDRRFNRYLGHRAIGVVYHPEREWGNYVPTLLTSRYDALLYFDRSNALHPIHMKPDGEKTPDTYPFGF